jgi:hypothetical protein
MTATMRARTADGFPGNLAPLGGGVLGNESNRAFVSAQHTIVRYALVRSFLPAGPGFVGQGQSSKWRCWLSELSVGVCVKLASARQSILCREIVGDENGRA